MEPNVELPGRRSVRLTAGLDRMEVLAIHRIDGPKEVSNFFPINHEVRYPKRVADSTKANAETLQYIGSSSKRLCAVMLSGVAKRTDDFIFRH